MTAPVFHDHHSHVSLYASMLGLPDLSTLERGEAFELLKSQPPDRISIVKGWRSDRLALEASELRDLPPVLVVNRSLHGLRLSPSGLPFAREIWPEFAERHEDGPWAERHLPELFAFYARLAGLDSVKIATFMEGLARLGLGSAEDLSTTGDEALAAIADSPWRDRVISWAAPAIWDGLSEESRRLVVGFKLFLDGSLGARSAALDRPFLGGETGSLLYRDEELEASLARLAPLGKDLAIHAIGHRAIDQALLAVSRSRRNGLAFPRVRLEHVQFISEAQARSARDEGMVLSMQPNFNADSIDYADRLPPELLAANDPFRMLMDKIGFRPGQDLVFGSDGMPHGIEFAQAQCVNPPFPGQAVRIEELEAGYSA